MSFDVFVQDIPAAALTVAEIPDNFEPQPIGKRSEIIAAILKAAPHANFSEAAWGTIDGPDYSIEVNISELDPVRGFAFHVRGSPDALDLIAEILKSLKLRAFAPGTESGFFKLNEVKSALGQWQAYSDQVMGDGNP